MRKMEVFPDTYVATVVNLSVIEWWAVVFGQTLSYCISSFVSGTAEHLMDGQFSDISKVHVIISCDLNRNQSTQPMFTIFLL